MDQQEQNQQIGRDPSDQPEFPSYPVNPEQPDDQLPTGQRRAGKLSRIIGALRRALSVKDDFQVDNGQPEGLQFGEKAPRQAPDDTGPEATEEVQPRQDPGRAESDGSEAEVIPAGVGGGQDETAEPTKTRRGLFGLIRDSLAGWKGMPASRPPLDGDTDGHESGAGRSQDCEPPSEIGRASCRERV